MSNRHIAIDSTPLTMTASGEVRLPWGVMASVRHTDDEGFVNVQCDEGYQYRLVPALAAGTYNVVVNASFYQ